MRSAFSMVARFAEAALDPDKTTLVVVTGSALLSWSLMLSQAMESVTRAFYTRSDLDLLLSSPIAAAKAFAVRIAAIAISVMSMSLLLAAPFINVLALRGGAALARAPISRSWPWRRPRSRSPPS